MDLQTYNFGTRYDVVLFAAALASVGYLSLAQSHSSTDSKTAVGPAAEAVKIAVDYSGFDSTRVTSCTKVDSRLCLADTSQSERQGNQNTVTCPVWKVKFDSVSISLPSWHKGFDSLQRDFSVLIDSSTGRLIAIYSTPIPPKAKASDILKETVSDTTYKTIKNATWQVPEKSFAAALNKAIGSNPARAVQIVATCVVEQPQPGEPIMCVWHIWGIGVHPFSFHREFAPDELGTSRTVVDATTGDPMMIDGPFFQFDG